jgi:DNA polymerase III delta subunit
LITTYHGKNTYYARKQIKERTAKADPLNVIHLGAPTLKELSAETQASPIFSTRRSIIVHSLENLEKDKQTISILENKRDTSHVIFIIEEYGKTHKKLSEYLRKSQVIKLPLFDAKKAKQYVEKEARYLGFNLNESSVLDYFLFLVGTDLESIDIELTNLAQHQSELKGRVSIMDLRKYVNRRTDTHVFNVTKAIFQGKLAEAITLIEQFINEKPDNLISLLHLLTADIKLGLIIKTTQSISQVPANPYRVKLLRKSMKGYTLEQLVQFFLSTNQAIYISRLGTNPLLIFYKGLYEFKE